MNYFRTSSQPMIFLALLFAFVANSSAQPTKLPGFSISPFFNEQLLTFKYPSDVTIHINAPDTMLNNRHTDLILYALPNGNSIDWTIGKEAGPGDDWHYEIQHIGAQTRFLRQHFHDRNIVTIYLQADGLSWPTWSSNHPNDKYPLITALVDSLRNLFADFPHSLVLNGHSGGGNFIFNFINSNDTIPDFVNRIAFLDSDYNYSNNLQHGDKLAQWLNTSPEKALCVLAYNDSVALYEGEPVVSPTGGTWYRSKMMQRKLSESFSFSFEENDEFYKYFALDGHIQFWLKKNPTRAILHTVQVEKNGFIHSIASATPHDHNGYQYYSAPAYLPFIQKLPPEEIRTLMLLNEPGGDLRLTFQPVEHGELYRIFISHNGVTASDSIDIRDSTYVLAGTSSDSLTFVRIQGISPWGKSPKSKLLAAVPGTASPQLLIVDGFDAAKGDNSRDFIRQHAVAFFDNGLNPVSASNTALTSGMIDPANYKIVDFFFGTDILVNESVSTDEQALLKTFLQNGGKLLISGSDIGYDLDSRGIASDKEFSHDYLKAKYHSRSPLNRTSTYYQIQFLTDWPENPGSFDFDDGTNGSYNVSRPNTLKGINGGQTCLVFSGVDSSDGVAGVCFNGLFPAGNLPGKVFVSSVPIETIYPNKARSLFLKSVLDFFNQPARAEFNSGSPVEKFELSVNYPNPFNATTRIAFTLAIDCEIQLTIYNTLGQTIARLAEGFLHAGEHSIDWDSVDQNSGVYFSCLKTDTGSQTKKMVLIK